MPLPTDEKLLALSDKVLKQFDAMFHGPRPGLRPVHAKGLLVSGTFTPAASATAASRISRTMIPTPGQVASPSASN
jgi:catalase